MIEISLALALAAFVAGLLMFLAPCTLPLVPAYLAFISGVNEDDAINSKQLRNKIRKNAFAFVFGFSIIFIVFGTLIGFFGTFIGQYRIFLSQVGGGFIILFGLMMLNVIHITPLLQERKFKLPKFITPGEPTSSVLIGGIFAMGWTPCVGPILASILLIAATKASVLSGALLLTIFSIGLAIPLLATALLYAQAGKFIKKYTYLSRGINIVGGIFLIGLGVLLVSNNFILTIQYGYQLFEFLGIGNLLEFY